MRKIKNFILILAMIVTMVPIIEHNTIAVQAKTSYSYYSLNCGSSYEVDTINDNGGFDYKGCYVDLSSAKSAMKSAGSDAVVRHAGSYSANQIVAMTSGFVYTSGFRSDSSTVSVYGYGASSSASTYIQNYRGMYYEDTLDYDGAGDGNVLVNAFGFEGTVSMSNVDFIPMKFFVNDLPIWVAGNAADGTDPWCVIPNSTYYKVVRNGNYLDLVYHGFNDYPSGGDYTHAESFTGNLAVGPAASWMSEGSIYYSLDDVTFYSDYSFTQKAGTYYNYYLYQPLRTRSNISADIYNSFLSEQGYDSSSALWDMGSAFINGQNTYGINAAMVFAQACCESAYGTSGYARNYNNLFGVGAYDDGPSVMNFESVTKSIYNQMGLLLRYYTDTDCAWYYGGTYGNKGAGITTKYASAATYGLTLASIYYRFDKYASGNNGSLTDAQSSTIGVLNDTVTNVYTDTTGSNVLYTYRYGYNTDYLKNQTVVILGKIGDYYQIQSTDYVSNGAQMHVDNKQYATYDWNAMIGYIKISDVKTLINADGSGIHDLSSAEDMYRLYNPNSGEHFYTADVNEKNNLSNIGWVYEGIGWKAPSSSSSPVYRLYNPNSGDHHYTMNVNERDWLVTLGWTSEGIGWYSDDAKSVPLYRQYNPNETVGTHNYTKSLAENDWLVTLGWTAEGIGWYGVN
ncbi:MAG: glucosaminidase domain-containing protein [Solobacterium sp.]|jgi:beta-N-acetylglucosaminidase|nr:glucosaminidase domain-containing protein [Solobacterium sp.]MCH4204927.1 glucosaminidase domain-containing protein [Solobacterium sp.]MCH4226319.1 glucosaminidase domain-containing protein [Solobacterium sp.]MCH4281720.1 glucosaminidase domain-containing protein [Solobacterium sp.]